MYMYVYVLYTRIHVCNMQQIFYILHNMQDSIGLNVFHTKQNIYSEMMCLNNLTASGILEMDPL